MSLMKVQVEEGRHHQIHQELHAQMTRDLAAHLPEQVCLLLLDTCSQPERHVLDHGNLVLAADTANMIW